MTQISDFIERFRSSKVSDGHIATYKSWFERYPSYAKESLSQITWLDGAWFELLLNELLSQLGCKVDAIDIDNTDKTPDFLAGYGVRKCYVEATTVNPRDNPSVVDYNLEDAIRRLNKLDSADFQIHLTVQGKLSRQLSNRDLEVFSRLLSKHDVPYAEIKGKNWVMRGERRPIPQEGKQPISPRLIVDGGGDYSGDASRNVQDKVAKKAKKYDGLDAPLLVAVNVLDPRFNQEAEMAALFGQEQIQYFPDHPEVGDSLIRESNGVWVKGGYEPRYTRLAGVMFFRSFFPWSPGGSASLYLNPFIDEPDLPKPIYRMPHTKGKYGRIRWVEGVDIGALLAIS